MCPIIGSVIIDDGEAVDKVNKTSFHVNLDAIAASELICNEISFVPTLSVSLSPTRSLTFYHLTRVNIFRSTRTQYSRDN